MDFALKLLAAGALLTASLGWGLVSANESSGPNIVFIMLDDLDLVDVGAFGGTAITTPNIDRVAREGMRFTRYYANGPVCSPTRAALLTGRYPSQLGIRRAVVKGSLRGIPANVATIAQVLKSAGYTTAHVGKWHVGTNKAEFLPDAKGFDHSVRLVDNDYLDYELVVDERVVEGDRPGEHLTAALTNHAIRFIEQSADAGKPFFLNLWYLAPHTPIQPPADYDNSETQYCLPGSPSACDAASGAYAALVSNADAHIGRILQVLSDRGIRERTLVIIASDNGGVPRYHPPQAERALRGYKGSVFEGGIRVPMVIRWPGVVPADTVNESTVMSMDFMPTLAEIARVSVAQLDLPGTSFAPALKRSERVDRDGPLFWETKYSNGYFANRSGTLNRYAVRDGFWKLVFEPGSRPDEQDSLMLFELTADEGERRDLAGQGRGWATGLLGYRVEVINTSDISSAPEVAAAVVTSLRSRYYRWRREVGRIDYEFAPSPAGVVVGEGDRWRFLGGVVAVRRNALLDFHDGDFTFRTRFAWAPSTASATIAEKPGSWSLTVEDGNVVLSIHDHAGDNRVVRLSASLPYPDSVHVAFSVHGLRGDRSRIHLYVNGLLADSLSQADSVTSVRSQDVPRKPMILIGNNEAGDAPFVGHIEKPLMSTLSYDPAEIMLDYAGLED